MNPRLAILGMCCVLVSLAALSIGWNVLGPLLLGVGVGYLGLALARDRLVSPVDTGTNQTDGNPR